MKSDGNSKARNEELKNATFEVIQQIVQSGGEQEKVTDLLLDRFRPTKHKRAYKFDRNFKKRCYAR